VMHGSMLILFLLSRYALAAHFLETDPNKDTTDTRSTAQCACNAENQLNVQMQPAQEKLVPPDGHATVQVFQNAILTTDNSVFINGKLQNTTYHGCGGSGQQAPDPQTCKSVTSAVMLNQGNHDMYWHLSTEIMSRLALVAKLHPEVVRSKKTVFALLPEAVPLASNWSAMYGSQHQCLTISAWLLSSSTCILSSI